MVYRYLLLFLITVGSLFYTRHKASELAQSMYTEGCEDAAAMLAREGKIDESGEVVVYCTWKKKVLKDWL